MPTYLYECETCAAQFETFGRYSDPNPPCEKCAAATRRMIAGGTDFILTGGGWTGKHYNTRIGTKPRKKPAVK